MSRLWPLAFATFLIVGAGHDVGALAASAASTDHKRIVRQYYKSVVRQCRIEVGGRVYLNSPCNVTTWARQPGPPESYTVTVGVSDNGKPTKYFAYMDIMETNPPAALVFWNGEGAETRAQAPLGALIQRGNCWANSRARLCIGSPGLAKPPRRLKADPL